LLAGVFMSSLGVASMLWLVFTSKRKREEGYLRAANLDPTAGSPGVSGFTVSVVLTLFFAFLLYVAVKHHI
jgi:hypothetical protein